MEILIRIDELTLHVHVLNLFPSFFVEICSWNGHRHHFVAFLWPVGFDKCDVNEDSEDSSDVRTDDGYPEPVEIVPATRRQMSLVMASNGTQFRDLFYLKDWSHPAMRLMRRGERSLAGLSA